MTSNSQNRASACTARPSPRDHLDCSVCLRTFEDPRQLPCGHFFCGPPERCFMGEVKNGHCYCPLCRNSIPVATAENLPAIPQLNEFLQMTLGDVRRAQKAEKCKPHGLGVQFSCSQCQVPMCANCVAGQHNGHRLESVTLQNKKLMEAKWLFQKFDSLRRNNKEAAEKSASLSSLRTVFHKASRASNKLCAMEELFESYSKVEATFEAHAGDTKTKIQECLGKGQMPSGRLHYVLDFLKVQEEKNVVKLPIVELSDSIEKFRKVCTELTDLIENLEEKFNRTEDRRRSNRKRPAATAPVINLEDSDTDSSDTNSIEFLG